VNEMVANKKTEKIGIVCLFFAILLVGIVLINPVAGSTVTSGYLSQGTSSLTAYQVTSSEKTQSFILSGPSGTDFDLFVKRGSAASPHSYDYYSNGYTSNEQVNIDSPIPGMYYVCVWAYTGSGGYTLTAPYRDLSGNTGYQNSVPTSTSSDSGWVSTYVPVYTPPQSSAYTYPSPSLSSGQTSVPTYNPPAYTSGRINTPSYSAPSARFSTLHSIYGY
jgi:hypothetical protein